jgi:hypothetical protein
MTTKKKPGWAAAGLLAAALLAMAGTGAWAVDLNTANDAEGLTVRITPNADYGVTIDTTNLQGGASGVIELGTLDMYASTFTVRPATVTIAGGVSRRGASNTGQELDVTAGISGGWFLDATPTTTGTGGEIDGLAMYLLFSPTSISQAPSGGEFVDGTGDVTATGTAIRAGGSAGGGVKFENGTDMDNLSVGNARHMWMYFRMPSETSTGSDQDVTVTLTATGSSL